MNKKLPSTWTDPPEPEPIKEHVKLHVTQKELDQYRGFICGSCGSITGGEAAGPRAVKLVCTQCTSNTLKPLFSPAAELTAKKYGLDINGLREEWTQEVGALIFKRRASTNTLWQVVAGLFLGLPLFLGMFEAHPKTTIFLTALGAGFYFFKKKKGA